MYSISNHSHAGMGDLFIYFAISPHETLTEADNSIYCPLIAPLVVFLVLTAEAPAFSQRQNNISVKATLLFPVQVHSHFSVIVLNAVCMHANAQHSPTDACECMHMHE